MQSSMADVAARAGVSVSTVSRALRASSLVSADTRARVLAAADTLDFAVSRAASSLATGKVGRIGVLVSGQLGAWFNGTILDGMYELLRDAGQELTIYRNSSAAERDAFFAQLPARRNADALIVASFSLTATERRRLRTLGMPVVYLNEQVRGSASVTIDDAAGAATVTRHLLGLGHRRLAYVLVDHPAYRRFGGPRLTSARLVGFQTAAQEAETPVETAVLRVSGDDDGEAAVAALLDGPGDLPTAVVAESDELALSILGALDGRGVRVPGELSVVGFDDHALAAAFGLTTVAQPVERLGWEAAAMALELAAGRSPQRPHLTVPTELVVRRSTAPPPD